MDLTESIVPKSDQLNADDLITGPRTFTVGEVIKGSAEQPVDIQLVEFPGRAYRPSKSMRRVMVTIWGQEASHYAGRRLTLYRDPDVTFGRDRVGGIKISHMSNLDQRSTVMLTASRGKRAPHVVEPLTDDAPNAPATPSAVEIAAMTDVDELRSWWRVVELRDAIQARVTELTKDEASE